MQKFYLGVIAVLLCIIFSMRMCSGKPAPCPAQPVLVKTDTAWIEKADSSGWLPIQPKSITRWKHDTLEISGQQLPALVDTPAILQDYFSRVYYEDTIRTQYGYIVVKDTITENRIANRKHVESFKLPVITNTVQLPPKKPRNQVYAGILAQGNKDNLLSGAGVELMLKTKKDQVYRVAALQQINGGQIYQIGTSWKISFRKK